MFDGVTKTHRSTFVDSIVGRSVVEVTATKAVKDEEIEMPVDPKIPVDLFLEDNVDLGIYPYNAYTHPFSHLKRDPNVSPALWATHMPRPLVPSIIPISLRPHQMLEAHNAYVSRQAPESPLHWVRAVWSLPTSRRPIKIMHMLTTMASSARHLLICFLVHDTHS